MLFRAQAGKDEDVPDSKPLVHKTMHATLRYGGGRRD